MQVNKPEQNPFIQKTESLNVKNRQRYNPYLTVSYKNEDSFVYSSDINKSTERQEFEKVKKQQGFIGKVWDSFKNLVGMKSGSKYTENVIKQAEKGEISKEEALNAIEKYKEGQKICVDVIADMASGILAVGAFSLAVGGAVFTGGLSLAGGLAVASSLGAGIKAGIKAGDAKATGKEYTGKDFIYDILTGGINGLLAPVTNGLGNCVTKTIGKKLGLNIIKEGAQEAVEQTVKQGIGQSIKSAILSQTVDVAGGTVLRRTAALGAGMAVDGALGGASDNMVRAALEGDNVIKAGIQGALGGAVMAPVIGGGFRMTAKAGKALNNKITTKLVLPDGLNTKFKQGNAGDCALLSTIDGMMNNPSAAKTLKKSITKTIGGDYNVKIGDDIVRVAKSSLSDEMLSDTTGIKIFEQAYKQLTGDIDGGFAEVVANQFGLNPVHITKNSITDELLDKLAKEQANTVLSFGTFVDADGVISSSGKNRHYFTIKNIDSDSKIVTLTSPIDTSVSIKMSYDDFKAAGISIDGGSLKDIDLPSVSRCPEDIEFKGINSDILSDMSKKIIACDSYDELDEDSVKRLLLSLYPDGDISDTSSLNKIQKIITKFNNDLDDCIYDDSENLSLVLDFIEKVHNIVGIENIDNYNLMSLMSDIMDGSEILCCQNPELVYKLGELLKEPLSGMDSETRVAIFTKLVQLTGDKTPDKNISVLIEQLQRLSSEFSGDELKTAITEVYKNGVAEEQIVQKLKNYELSSRLYKLLKPENILEDDFNRCFADVIKELSDRGYSTNEINQLLKYRYTSFFSRDFIRNQNIKLFADTIELYGNLGDTAILTEYTTGSGPFNDILTVPVDNVDDLPVPNIDFSEKGYNFATAKQKVKELETILKDVRTKRDMTVYRGEGYEVLNAFELSNGEMLGSALEEAMNKNNQQRINEIIAEVLGAEVVQPHFMSTSYKEGGAVMFLKHDGGGVLWEINAPKGSQGIYIDPFNSVNGTESEILFNRNTKLLIKNAEVKDGVFRISADIVPNGSN